MWKCENEFEIRRLFGNVQSSFHKINIRSSRWRNSVTFLEECVSFIVLASVIKEIIAPAFNLSCDQTVTESTFSLHTFYWSLFGFSTVTHPLSVIHPPLPPSPIELVVFDWHFVTRFIYFSETFMNQALFRSTFIAGLRDYLWQWQDCSGDILLIITYQNEKQNVALKHNMYCIALNI